MSRLNRVLTVLTLTLVVSAPAFAASYVVPPDRILFEKSDAVVVGHVTSSQVQRGVGGNPATIYDIRVDEIIKGAVPQQLQLGEPGGTLGNVTRVINGAPVFHDGESVLLFLVGGEGHYATTDLGLGAFHFAEDTAGVKLAVRDEAELFGWDLNGQPHREIRRSAEKFVNYLHELARNVPVQAAEDYAVAARPLKSDEPISRMQSDAVSPKLRTNVTYSATSYLMDSTTGNGTGLGARWKTFPAAVNWNQGNQITVPGSGTAAITAAFNAWNGDGCSNVNYVLVSSTANLKGIQDGVDGVNNIVFEKTLNNGANPPVDYPPFGCATGGLLGLGGITNASTGCGTCDHTFNGETFATMVEGDVSMNRGIQGCTSLTVGNLNSAVTHEVGHTLGFRHADQNRAPSGGTCDPNTMECATSAIMTSAVTSGINATLQPWDQHAVQKVYASACAGTSVKGDFTGDGKTDIVWRNNSNGANAVWEMNGTVATGVIINLDALPNTQYQIAGTADFNGDGKQDILWRNSTTGANALWLMNGAVVTSIVNLPGLPGTNFSFEGTADFDGNGTPDIIIRNYANGNNALWLMSGTNYMSTVNLPALPNTNYHIEGAADFDGNGTPDIVWRNYDPAGIGAVALWTMTGTTQTGIVNLPALPNVSYKLSGVGDFDGDGKPDIVWRNPVTGANALWLMNGTTYSSTVNLPGLANSSYEIRGPR